MRKIIRWKKRHLYFALTLFILILPLVAWSQAKPADKSAVSAAPAAQGSVRLPTTGTPPARDVKETPPPSDEKEAAVVPKESKEKKGEGMNVEVSGEDRVYLNVQNQDIKDVIKQIGKATGKNFIIDDKIKGNVTILSERTMSKEEAYQAFLSALEVAGYTTVTGPGGIIKIVALGDAKKAPIPIYVESTPYTDSYVTRLISLKNISASDMSAAIKDLISKNGTLFAYPATNTLIITDSGTNIDRLMKIIKELDQEGPQQVLEIIPINNADAKDVAAKVLSLFELDKSAAQKKPGTGELEEMKDVSKIIADERTNSVIVLASKRAIDKVRSIIAKLDVPLNVGDTGTIHVYYLKYAQAKDLVPVISAATSGGKNAAKAAATPAAGGDKSKPAEKGPPAVAQLEGGLTIAADETNNALIITASAKDFQVLIDELISKLDRPNRQVYLESIVMELEVVKGSQAGASGFGGGGGKSMIGFGNFGTGDLNTLTGLFNPATFFATPGMLGGLLSRDSVTVTVPKVGGGTQDLTIPAFSAFLNLLQSYRDANIVSTPNIMTIDGKKATIEVTKKQYIPQATTVATAGSVLSGSTPVEAGLTLEVTPQITEGNSVKLEIHQKLSNFTGAAVNGLGPPETKREISTTVVAMDGQTVVLGGLMQDEVTHNKNKVPILGDIPLIGLLFKQTQDSNGKSNLLVFITPHVVKDPADFAEVSKMKIEQRNRFIDQNYGKRQQKAIRDTIATHRADLLEFTSQTPISSPPVISPSPGAGAEPAAPAQQKPKKKVAKAKPAEPVVIESPEKAPVISVSPIGANDEKGSLAAAPKSKSQTAPKPPATKQKTSGDVDTAY